METWTRQWWHEWRYRIEVIATLIALMILLVFLTACSMRPIQAPTQASAGSGRPTWVLSGQSNAVALREPLATYATVIDNSRNATPIAAWDDGQPLWIELATRLREPHTAFVWWQGESDALAADASLYLPRLAIFIDRVRAISNTVVVICSANSVPAFNDLRRVQQEYAATHLNVLFVPTNDLTPDTAGDYDVPTQMILPPNTLPNTVPHLTIEGYRIVAARIAAKLRAN